MEFSMEPFVRYIAKTSYYIDRELVANDCRILYVVSGDGQFESGNKAYPLSAGALVCYPYGIPYRVSSQTGLTFYTINFDFDFENSNISTMMPKETHNHKPQNEIHSIKQQWQATFLKVNFLEKAFWADELFAGIYNEAVNKKDGYQRMQSAYMRRFLIELYRRVNNGGHKNPLCAQMKELILKNPSLNNKQLGEILNYHPFYLNEVMQKNEGVSLHKYIMKQRLKRAYEQITTTAYSLETVAVGCGFSSQSHLSSAFRAEYQISPSVLRRQI